MPSAIIGKKLGMTQRFAEDGSVVPVTVVQAGPCVVVQRKTRERDGYEAIQLGTGRAGTPGAGHEAPRRAFQEGRCGSLQSYCGSSGSIAKKRVSRQRLSRRVQGWRFHQSVRFQSERQGQRTRREQREGIRRRRETSRLRRRSCRLTGPCFTVPPARLGMSAYPSRVLGGYESSRSDGKRSRGGQRICRLSKSTKKRICFC